MKKEKEEEEGGGGEIDGLCYLQEDRTRTSKANIIPSKIDAV
jgi:hypothetical protein